MVSEETKRPDAAAMERIFARHPYSPEGTILRLAWLEGLSRKELNELTWEQVDFETQTLILPDRTVPLDPSVSECLQKRYERYGAVSNRVIIADRGKKPMTLENVSRLAKGALDCEGQDISLKDLRRDWIVRQIQTNGWAYAARVSGMAVSTLRGNFAASLWSGKSQMEGLQSTENETEFALWKIVQQEGNSAAGLAIWMCWKLGMQPGEAATLTWDQVDLAMGVIRLSDRNISMGMRMQRLLKEAWNRQKGLSTPQIFVTPTTGSPMDQSRLSVVSRTAMIRGGLEGFSLRTLYVWAKDSQVEQKIVRLAEERGALIRNDVVELLGVSARTAWVYLDRLTSSGKLTKVGVRYYLVGSVISPEDQLTVLRTYLEEHGVGSRQKFARLLGVTPQQTTHILQGMVARGELVLVRKRYYLPDHS